MKLIRMAGMVCPLLFLLTASVYAQDTCEGGNAVGNDVYNEWELQQDQCETLAGEAAYKLGFQSYNKTHDINGWYISITRFDSLNCWRHDSSQRDVDGVGRLPDPDPVLETERIKVMVTHYLDTTQQYPCPNTMGMRHVLWYCRDYTPPGDEGNDALAFPATYAVKAIPDHIWEIDAPVEHPGPEGDYVHTFTLRNEDASETLYIDDLYVLVSTTRYADLSGDVIPIPWGTNLLTVQESLAANGGTLERDIYTVGGNTGKYIYVKYVSTNFESRLRHAAHPLIPAVSEWGLLVMLLLVVAAGTIVIRRRRATVA